MSISVYARICGNKLNEKTMDNILRKYFNVQEKINKITDDRCITYNDFYDFYGMQISFIEKKEAPYNVFDSELLNKEYEYTQVLIFNINKNNDLLELYNNIIKLCYILGKKIKTDMLITSDCHGEICFISSFSNVLWS